MTNDVTGRMVQREPSIALVLIEKVLATCRESGATLEESLAALRSAIELLPLVGLQSKTNVTIRT